VKRTGIALAYVVATLLTVLLIQRVLHAEPAAILSYSEFKTLLKKGRVSDLVLGPQVITGAFAAEGLEGVWPKDRLDELKRSANGAALHFTTTRVEDPGLVAELEAAGVKFTGRVDATWISTILSWVVPMLAFMGIWMFAMRRMGGVAGASPHSERAGPGSICSTAPA
jgi:cell division protease FtsH